MEHSPIRPFAISCGDPAGIGPEVIVKSWQQRHSAKLHPFFIVGNIADFERFAGISVRKITDPSEAVALFDDHLPVLQVHYSDAAIPGQPTIDGAQCSMRALEFACGLTRTGDAAAIITGPVSKSQLYKVGFRYPGQTEYVSQCCGIAPENAVMMLAGPSLKVIPLTTHIALKDVPIALTKELIIAHATTAHKAMIRNFDILTPRIAVAGLNPHAGEDGNLGKEEILVMQPAINELRQEGLDISPPQPADSLFHEEARAKYDVVLCPYHDQALVPLKTLHFFDGINMTLGLPIIRTSPDHGTAFGIAGQDIADPRSMIAAIQMAQTAMINRQKHDS